MLLELFRNTRVCRGGSFCFLHFNTNLSCRELSRHKFVLKNRNKVFLFNSQCFPSNHIWFESLIYNPENILYIRSPSWQQHSRIFKSDNSKSSINRISGWSELADGTCQKVPLLSQFWEKRRKKKSLGNIVKHLWKKRFSRLVFGQISGQKKAFWKLPIVIVVLSFECRFRTLPHGH